MYKIIKVFTPIIAVFFILSSCARKHIESPKPEIFTQTEDSKLSPAELSALEIAFGNIRISETEAQIIAFNFLKESNLSNKVNKRQETSDRSLSSTQVVWYNVASKPNVQGRIEADSIPLYVYNFKTSTDSTAGFAIVSGDKRLPQVLVCTIDGNIADTNMATGAQTLLANIPAYVDYETNRRQLEMEANIASALEKIKKQIPDSIKQKIGSNIPLNTNLRTQGEQVWQLQNVTWGNWETIVSVGPLIKTKWGQESPYNAQVPFTCVYDDYYKGRAPVGCQATAMAQIMAYWRFPNNYQNIPFYWNNILNLEKNSISTLFYTIAQLSSMKYGCSGSSASDDNILSAYKAMGYQNVNGTQSYDLGVIRSSLSVGAPIHIMGCDQTNVKCHAWLIDGYIYRRIPWTGAMVLYDNSVPIYGYMTSGYQYDQYVQCNFGWSGIADGLYVSGVFNTGRQSTPTLGDPNLVSKGAPSSTTYISDLRIVPFIHP